MIRSSRFSGGVEIQGIFDISILNEGISISDSFRRAIFFFSNGGFSALNRQETIKWSETRDTASGSVIEHSLSERVIIKSSVWPDV